MDRMKELVALLNKYAYHYYVLDEPIVADKQYDELYNELLALEEKTGVRASRFADSSYRRRSDQGIQTSYTPSQTLQSR